MGVERCRTGIKLGVRLITYHNLFNLATASNPLSKHQSRDDLYYLLISITA